MNATHKGAYLLDPTIVRLFDLMAEYSGKLGKLSARANDIPLEITKAKTQAADRGNWGMRILEPAVQALESEFESLQLSAEKLVPASQELARHASQLVEYADLPLLGSTGIEIAPGRAGSCLHSRDRAVNDKVNID